MLIGRPPFETSHTKHTYKRIKLCDYTIPDEAGLSAEARSLITRILVLNPQRRPSLDEIMQDRFMIKNAIPKQLPKSALSMPLTKEFIGQYIVKVEKNESSKLQSNSTTTGSLLKAELTSKEHPGKQMRSQQSSEALIEASNKPGTSLAGTIRPSIKANNYITGEQHPVIPQIRTGSAAPPMMLSTMKSPPRILSTVTTSQGPRLGNPPLQSKILSGHDSGLPSRRFLTTASAATRSSENGEYVQHYQDYIYKYGVGYVLTNGVIGFCYNDMTNLLWFESKDKYGYSDYYGKNDKAGMVYIKDDGNNERNIEKKLKIIKHFVNHCDKLDVVKKSTIPKLSSANNEEVAVKRIIKTRKGILFRLTNNLTQMIFLDNSQIITSFNKKYLIYISKKGVKENLKINNDLVMMADEKIVSRFKYVLNVINQLNISKRAGTAVKSDLNEIVQIIYSQ